MLFNSWQFLVFFPVVTILYFAFPFRLRWFLLLVASCVFYMAFIPVYILILAFTIVIDYFAGLIIGGARGQRRKVYLLLSIVSNVGILAFFKYYNFISENITGLARLLHWNYSLRSLAIILPIGLSFHTFQAMSYTIEVYRGHQKPERHFGIYALYVMFYPQLVAGPIERPQNLLHQFYEKHGLKLMLWGMFKKVVIADRLALFVDNVYNQPTNYKGVPLIVATVFFAFQIYCDFSGYSDIAIGAAQVMGFRLMTNYNRPYHAKSIAEFWKRWHISLSTWFRDYLLFSLGGNRIKWRFYFNLFLTFLVSGLWHGARWTFVIWGALNGFYLLFSIWTKDVRTRLLRVTGIWGSKIHKYLQVAATFALVCFAWIFFRANNLADALYIITHSLAGAGDFLSNVGQKESLRPLLLGRTAEEFLIAVAAIGFMEFIHLIQRHRGIRHMLSGKPIYLRWPVYYALVLFILAFGEFGVKQFIYFQF
jgi:D-alanyl-lipoteichoic acid acyltransferase DltB (MBOAT superfamily)